MVVLEVCLVQRPRWKLRVQDGPSSAIIRIQRKRLFLLGFCRSILRIWGMVVMPFRIFLRLRSPRRCLMTVATKMWIRWSKSFVWFLWGQKWFLFAWRSIYREHLEAFLDAIMSLEFNTVESLWREFWRSQDNNNGDECEEEKYLSK